MMNRFLPLLLLLVGVLAADCKGKVDLAPLYMKTDLLKFGKPDQTYYMTGARGAADYFIWKPILVRATAIAAWGRRNAHFQAYTAGLGACLPYRQLYFTPTVGIIYSRFSSDNGKVREFGLKNLDQKFTGYGPYVGLDIQWVICETWRIGGGFQYSWSRTSSTMKPAFSGVKDNSKGPTWTAQLEKDLTPNWSLNIAGAYNRSLNHEKHGLKAQGVKIGLTYWFD